MTTTVSVGSVAALLVKMPKLKPDRQLVQFNDGCNQQSMHVHVGGLRTIRA